jgi:hypothetical protein
MKKFLSDVLINCDLTVSGSTSLGAATGITVDTSDNSNKIATTAWVKGLGFSTANTTYLLDVPANTTNFRLIGSDSSTDTITLSAAGASSITRVSASELRITSSDSIDYVNSVSLVGTDLTFASVGNGFTGSVDLSGITGSFNAEEVQTVYENIKNVSGGPIQKGTPLAVVPGQTSGNLSDVVPADANDPERMPAVFIANEDLADQAEGLGVVYGNITGIDTSEYDSGVTVYVAPGGGWTVTKPDGDALIQNLGIITKVHPSNGGGVVMGAGRSNDVPNIPTGYAWVGNANGVATPTLLGSLAYSSATYDNYVSWNLKTNGVQRTTVQSGGNLDIVAGSNVSVAYGAGGVVTISSTDTNTDTNNYITGLSFNTGNGILTATRQGLTDLTVDLDGRYLTSYTETDTLESVTGRGATTSNSIQVGGFLAASTVDTNSTTKAEMLANAVAKFKPHVLNSGSLAIAQVDNGNSVGLQFTNGAGTADWDIALQPFGGNVGIGTTSASQKLHVVGKALITDDVQLTGSNPRIDFNSNGASSLRFYDTTNALERMRINQDGNVGIGDSAPSFILDVNNASSRVRFKAATGDSNLELSAIAGHDWLIQSKADGEFRIYDEDAAAVRFNIDTSGNIQLPAYGAGLLTSDASGNITVDTSTYLTSVPNTLRQGTTLLDTAIEYYDEDSGGDLSWAVGADDRGGAGAAGQNAFVFRYNRGVRFGDTTWRGEGTEVLTLDDSGNVGILTPQAQITERLNVNGNIKSTGYLIIGGDDAARIALGSGTGNPVPQEIASFGSSVHIGAFIDFTIYNQTKEHMRSGTLQLVFNADQVMFNEVSTMDIGDTTPCLLTAVNNAGVVSVLFETPDPTFHIKYQTRTI